MRELFKSMMDCSWAMSTFGVRQFTNLMGGSSGPLDLMTPRYAMRAGLEVMQQSAAIFRQVWPTADGAAACAELQNKLEAFNLFEYVDVALNLPPDAPTTLPDMVRRASPLGPYSSVWATEGVGHYYTRRSWAGNQALGGLFADPETLGLPSGSMIPLHAGMGLVFADRLLSAIRVGPDEAEMRRTLARFGNLCRENSAEGYAGAAYEALGLVARNLYPHLIPAIDRALLEIDATLDGYFWHGVGRGLYFAATNALPLTAAPWRSAGMCDTEPPHESGRLNALAGLAFALTLVNIRHPEVIEAFLRHHEARVVEDGAFTNGVASAIVTWYDFDPGDPFLAAWIEHRVCRCTPALSQLWDQQVKAPSLDAVRRYHGVLRENRCLGEVFRYQSLAGLAADLEGKALEYPDPLRR